MPRVRPPISLRGRLGAGEVSSGHDHVAAVVGVGLGELAAEPLRAADDDDIPVAIRSPFVRSRRQAPSAEAGPSPKAPLSSEHKRPGIDASTPSTFDRTTARSDRGAGKPGPASSRGVRKCRIRYFRSATVDTARRTCTEWTPGRGKPLHRRPAPQGRSVDRPRSSVRRERRRRRPLPAGLARHRRARDRRRDHRARRAPAHVVGVRPALHDDSRDRGARADARGHARRHRPLDLRASSPSAETCSSA